MSIGNNGNAKQQGQLGPSRIVHKCRRRILESPIFHQNAKLLALGTFASANAKDSTFALPNAKNTNMLVSLALGDANFCHVHFFFLCVDFICVG